MTRREFSAAAPWLWAKAEAAPPPNILFLMPDQWRGMDLGCAGNKEVRTPVLDRLAARGAMFDSAVANTPVCTPARSSLITGKYAHQVKTAVNDVPLASEENGIAKELSRAGYFTGLVGKWHLEGGKRNPGFVAPGPRRQGFDWWAANICSHQYFKQWYFRDDPTVRPMKEYDSVGWTNLALDFLDTAKERKQPWFLCVHWGPPHDPYLWPPGLEKSYDPAKITLRPNWQTPKRLGTREHIAAYYAAIECLDQQVGRLLERADDNTLVVFLSDHGDMLGSHGVSLKRKPWEESARVPLIFHWPKGGITGGWRTKTPISHIDLVPTLLGCAGLKKTREMEGSDFSGFLRTRKGKDLPKHSMLMSQSFTENREYPPWRGLRTTKWKYARFQDKPWVLYDLEADPFELNNLADKPQHAKLRAGFDREIEAWMQRTGDDWKEQVDWLLRPENAGAR
ncbi:MAG: sulfatase [Bryobacter sp.]|nr:sulfatase [Bryobacter sp.]